MVWRLNKKTCQNSGKIIPLSSKSAAWFVLEITWHLIILEAAPVIQCLRTTTPAMMYVVCTCKPCSKPFWQTWLDIRLTTSTAIIHRQCICLENRSKMAKHPNLQMRKEGCIRRFKCIRKGTMCRYVSCQWTDRRTANREANGHMNRWGTGCTITKSSSCSGCICFNLDVPRHLNRLYNYFL